MVSLKELDRGCFTSQMSQWWGGAKARSWELDPGLGRGWQDPKCLSHLGCLSGSGIRSWELNPGMSVPTPPVQQPQVRSHMLLSDSLLHASCEDGGVHAVAHCLRLVFCGSVCPKKPPGRVCAGQLMTWGAHTVTQDLSLGAVGVR